tara:strand:+ start:126 stop:1217 length:1092 start_codon:yes stop_codon:yes gene_type:complete
MSCNNCNTGSKGLPKGCNNNGNCSSGGCGAFTVFDWLADISATTKNSFKIVEVRFKNGRKEYFRNNELAVVKGKPIITSSESGYDIGEVTLTGELVKNQMKKKGLNIHDELLSLLRFPNEKEINKWQELITKEHNIQVKARTIAIQSGLKMKISDVEFQADGSKLIFYYTADGRVDFRELIKRYAGEFKTRIEMKQVGRREEASILGGIGSCGRELCCSTWLKDLRKVNTSSARYQKLAINPEKLAGQCGKLKCCLNYELDTYLDALKDFPKKDVKIKTKKGIAVLQKTDIFKKRVWYSYKDNYMQWFEFDLKALNKMIKINKSDKDISALEDYSIFNQAKIKTSSENSITRFDKNKKRQHAL